MTKIRLHSPACVLTDLLRNQRLPAVAAAVMLAPAAVFAGDPFAHCAAPGGQPVAATPGATEIRIDAASMQSTIDADLTLFEGDVHLVRGAETLDADALRYNSATREVQASGNLHILRPGMDVTGSRAEYDLDAGTGTINDAVFAMPVERFVARGRAEHAAIEDENTTRFKHIVFSTCVAEEGVWALHADSLRLDKEDGTGFAEGARLELFGMTLPQLPQLSFPIDRRGLSGFLVPSLGYSGKSGFYVRTPYYWRLADNYDVTLAPRVMSGRGVELDGEFRFLTPTTRGTLFGSVIPRDFDYQDGEQARGNAGIVTHSEFGAHWVADVSARIASDDEYTADLGNGLYEFSTSHLGRTAQAEYRAEDWQLLFRVQGFQTIDDTIVLADRPYNRLPQVRFDADYPLSGGLRLGLASEYTNFTRDDSIEGQRIDLTPSIGWSWREPWAYFEPTLGFRATEYRLRDTLPGQDDEPGRGTAIVNLDAGMFFDRDADWFGHPVNQTLEPRVYYLYVPREDQSDLPVFDTSSYDFTFDSLFRTNRFSGGDRQGDANRISLALSSRLLDDASGHELLRVNLAETFHLASERVTLPGEPQVRAGSSALVADVSGRLDANWFARAGIQLDTDTPGRDIEQSLAQLVYRDGRDTAFSATWRQRDGLVENTDLAGVWRTSPTTSIIGRWNYSLQHERTRELMGGLEYGNCCWRLRALVRHYADDDDRYDTAFMLQIALNGLGHLGDNVDRFIERGIYAYRTEYP